MNTIVFLGIVQCLFLTFLVISKSNRGIQEVWLAVFLIFNALHLLFFFANFNVEYLKYQTILLAGSGFPLLNGPLFFIYVSSLVSKKQMPVKYVILHFIPYVLFCLVFYYYILFRPEMSGIRVFDGFLHALDDLIWPLRNISIFFAISGGAYPIWALLLLRRHTEKLYDEFSYFDKINLNWIKYWIIFSIVGFVVAFLIILIAVDYNYIERHDSAFKVVASFITVQVFFIGYYGLKQSTIFSNVDLPNVVDTTIAPLAKQEEKYASSRIGDDIAKKHVANLRKTMEETKPYLNSKLSIGMLSTSLNISSHHLSQILNDQLGKNFFDFVNEYRVEEIKIKIGAPEFAHLTILGLAYDCGFNSKSSFNSVFKKVTGVTPSDFKKNNP